MFGEVECGIAWKPKTSSHLVTPLPRTLEWCPPALQRPSGLCALAVQVWQVLVVAASATSLAPSGLAALSSRSLLSGLIHSPWTPGPGESVSSYSQLCAPGPLGTGLPDACLLVCSQ